MEIPVFELGKPPLGSRVTLEMHALRQFGRILRGRSCVVMTASSGIEPTG